MRDLVAHFAAHLREDWDARYYWAMIGFLAVALGAMVAVDFEGTVVDAYYGDPRQIPMYVLFYGVPWAVGVVGHAWFHGRTAVLREPRLWLAGLAALLAFAVYANFHYYEDWIAANVDPRGRSFVFRCAANLLRAGLGIALVLGFWWFVDRGRQPVYGLRRGGFRWRPYALILLGLVPLVAWASTRPEFLTVYPRHLPGGEEVWGLTPALSYAIFEVCYGADFVFTELFFRGLLIMGFTRWLGSGAVVPSTLWYAFIHVSKPAGEAIGSVFGGWALGVLALRTRSIWAGVVLHLGLAYMMEVAAILRRSMMS